MKKTDLEKALNYSIPFFDLKRQYVNIKEEIDKAITSVLTKGNFILGEEVEAFEEEYAKYLGVKHAIGVASGTEALYLSLLAAGIGSGDEVITIPNTAVPTVAAISQSGAIPVFVDINPETFTMDTGKLEAGITSKTRAVIPVHLYGHVVDMGPLMEIARKYSLVVIEDACQAHGAEYYGKKVGTIGNIGAFSFYPTKNLGAYGDGGMVVTTDDDLSRKLRLLRFYGMTDREKYLHEIKGINSRLDEIQAAILRIKLKYLDRWNEKRREITARYNELLSGLPLKTPVEPAYARQVYHLYVVRTECRDELRRHLEQANIGSSVHYPLPVHWQPSYTELNLGEGSFPQAEMCAREVLSLPIFPELEEVEIRHVTNTIIDFFQ